MLVRIKNFNNLIKGILVGDKMKNILLFIATEI